MSHNSTPSKDIPNNRPERNLKIVGLFQTVTKTSLSKDVWKRYDGQNFSNSKKSTLSLKCRKKIKMQMTRERKQFSGDDCKNFMAMNCSFLYIFVLCIQPPPILARKKCLVNSIKTLYEKFITALPQPLIHVHQNSLRMDVTNIWTWTLCSAV